MRDIIVSLIIVGLFPACFRRPFVGLCVFTWLAYMRVQDLTWHFARDIRWSFYVAILMLAGFFLSRDRGKRFLLPDLRNYLMVGLAVIVGIGFAISEEPTLREFNGYLEFVKIIVVALFTTGIVKNREQLRIMLWIVALSLGFYGVKTGIGGIVSLGAPVIQGPGGMMRDNNDFSLAMAMAVPMLFHLGWTERRPELRRAFWFSVPLTVMAVGLTRSRGGFLSVVAAIGMLIWRSRNRLTGILIGLLIAVAAVIVAPQDYKDRLATLKNPLEEGSAASRVRAWGIASRMAVDNPVLGVGFGKFQYHFVEYAKDPTPGELRGLSIVAHSSYFQVWAECGTPALVIYLTLIVWSLVTCWRIRKMARARYYSSWIISYAGMFEASLVTFTVGAAFLNRAHFDLFYHWVGLIIVFDHIARKEMLDEAQHPVRTGGRAEIHNVPKHGFLPAAG